MLSLTTNPNSRISEITTLFLEKNFTKSQTLRRLRLLKEFLNFKFFELNKDISLGLEIEEFQKRGQLKTNPENLVDDIIFFKELGTSFFNLFNITNLNHQVVWLESGVNSTKTIILYLPFEFPNNEIEKLGLWFKTNLGANTLFEVNFDPELIGGCSISYNGIIKDYSLKQQLQQNKAEILKQLLSFKR